MAEKYACLNYSSMTVSHIAFKIQQFLLEYPGYNSYDISIHIKMNTGPDFEALYGLGYESYAEIEFSPRAEKAEPSCPHCDNTGIINHGYLRGLDCDCQTLHE